MTETKIETPDTRRDTQPPAHAVLHPDAHAQTPADANAAAHADPRPHPPEDAAAREIEALTETLSTDTTATSFGVFKPVGHVMVGLPLPGQLLALVRRLRSAGWSAETLLRFDAGEAVPELETMVAGAGVLAGFGYEITLLRRYLALTRKGYGWLLVQAEDAERAQAVAAFARDCGARVAVHYRTLSVEELIE
ncbi:MAG TPA: hypothetical protein VET87_23135 [Rubrivivax sp.]|nr:hypothetical protein [Rubrivivax sp.]